MTTPPTNTGVEPNRQHVLISGASFAGLATAFWLTKLGYQVTLVELSHTLRKGGTPVDIREDVVEVVRRMGLLERIAACSLKPRPTEMIGPRSAIMTEGRSQAHEAQSSEGYEIERDSLLELLFEQVKDDVEILFGESIAAIEQSADAVSVTFASGSQAAYSFLVGCDGTHSAVRRMCFGDESSFSLYMGSYFSLTIVDRPLLAADTGQMFYVPGKTVMLNTYNEKTDIAFCFSSDEIAYDRRDLEAQKRMILEHFAGEGWRIPELLEEVRQSENFYFDKLCQIRMPAWSQGRVVLVGDAAYCPSPTAGMGGSMAILGATALADAFTRFPDDLRLAFAEYERSFRPVAEAIQSQAVEFGLEMVMPGSAEATLRRSLQLNQV